MPQTVRHIRSVRVVGKNSTIIALHPKIVKQCGIREKMMIEQRPLANGTIVLKPLKLL